MKYPPQPPNSFSCRTFARCASLLSSSSSSIYSVYTSKCLRLNSLRALEISCLSFFNPFPLFSIVCGLFSQKAGVVGGHRFSKFRPKKRVYLPSANYL